MAVHFVNITPQEFQEVALFKLIKENYIGSTLGSAKPYLYFANPASWSDAFEKRFINVLYKNSHASSSERQIFNISLPPRSSK